MALSKLGHIFFFFLLLKVANNVVLIKTNVFLKNYRFRVVTFPGEQTFVVEISDQSVDNCSET